MSKSKLIITSAIIAATANFMIANPVISADNNKPMSIKEAVKLLGIDKANKEFTFSKKIIEKDRAIYQNVSLSGDFKANQLIISFSPADKNIEMSLDDVDLSASGDEIKIKSAYIHFDEDIRKANDKNIFKKSLSIAKDSDFKGDIRLNGMNVKSKAEGFELKIGEIYVNDGVFSKDDMRFSAIGVSDVNMPYKGLDFQMEKFEIAGLSDATFDLISKKRKEDAEGGMTEKKEVLATGLDALKSFEVAKFKISGVKINADPKIKDSNSSPLKAFSFELGNFELNNISDKKIGRIAIENILGKADFQGENMLFKIGELSLDNLRIEFLKTIIAYSMKPKDDSKYNALSEKTLYDYYPGGPLDSGLSAYKFKDFIISGMGAKIALDNLSLITKTNSNGLVTDLELPNGEFSIKISDKEKVFGKIMAEGLDKIGLKEVIINYGASANYVPETDRVIYNKSYFSFKDFGEVSFSGVSSGQLAWIKKTKIKDVLELYKTTNEIADPKDGDVTSSKAPVLPNIKPQEWDDLFKFYDGLKIHSAKFEVKDFGAINRIALSEALTKGKSAKEIKYEWAKPLFDISGDKKSSLLARDASNVLGRMISDGGSVTIEANNQAGFNISEFIKNAKNYKDLGVSVKHNK